MELLEKRYRMENEIMHAVARGDDDAALRLVRAFPLKGLAVRARGRLRSVKNMLIVLSTLMRKAAESGGVHPVYIDQISAAFSERVEHVRNEQEAMALTVEMVRRYCALVRTHAHTGHSRAVQRALDHIQLNLTTALTLKSVAAALGFEPTYLSAQFSREMGVTLTGYIHAQRMRKAARLLAETDMPIGEVAGRVGMEDVNYFSRLFRRQYGQTPTQYRNGCHSGPAVP